MATRKKKVEDQITDAVTVVKGSHLTVTTYPDGKTKLEWDDEALLRDVQKALTEYENSVKVTTTETKPKRKKKNEA
jgi:uncharacterized protein YqgV (UPF0045/DUF77 family)